MKVQSRKIMVTKNNANDNEFPFLVCQKAFFVTQIYHFVVIMSPLWHHHTSRLVFISSIKRLIEYIQTG